MESFSKWAERILLSLLAALFVVYVAGTIYALFGGNNQFYCDWTGYYYPHLNCKPRGQS